MNKAREYFLRRFSVNIPLQTCVVYFPHTIEYIMVEKHTEGGNPEVSEEPTEPVMEEKMVCKVADACWTKYAEFMVDEAIEFQLTADELDQVSEYLSTNLAQIYI
jgi:hypothetical protein